MRRHNDHGVCVKDRLARYIATELLNRSELLIQDDDDLLTSGLLDSLSVMSVVYFIEQEAGIDIPAEDVTIENFASLSAIDAYLRRR
jgi:acyl carrier protein